MKKLIIFHSGNPGWMSCRKAIGVAQKMQEDFSNKINVEIHTTDSEAAWGYVFRGATTVFWW